MRKLITMVSIVAMLCSMTGSTNYGTAKAADVAGNTADTVSGGAIKQEEQTTAVPSENTSESDDPNGEIQIGDFKIIKSEVYEYGDAYNKKEMWFIESYLGNSSKVIIPDEYQGEKIEGIDSGVFENHTELEEVELPKSLKIIDEKAFRNCTNLKKIEIPETVERIYEYAFEGCTKLKKINLPKALYAIFGYSFMNAGVEEFTIDNKNSAFTTVDGSIYNKECTQLVAVPPQKSKLELPDTVTEINDHAAEENKQLTKVKFSNTLKTVGCGAFQNCSALKDVEFPNTLKTIENYAFDGCSALKEVKFSNTLKTINFYAFGYCIKLKDVYIPASVTVLNNSAFAGCNNMKSFKIDSKNKKYSASNGNFYNKNKTIFYASVTNKTSVTLPKSVKTVSDYAFELYSGNVKKIKVAKGNKYFSVYDNVLYNKKKTRLYFCPDSNKSITLPATLTDDYSHLFGDELEKIQVKAANKVFSSYKGALYNKKKTELLYVPPKIKSIVLPKTLTSDSGIIRDLVCCTNVTSVAVDAGNKKFQVKDGILYNKELTKVYFCTKNKKTVVLPKTVKKIEVRAFYECKKLKNITFSEKLERVGGLAFENCSSLEYVRFPDRAVCIEALAFVNCSHLKWVYVSKKVYFSEWYIVRIFAGCNNLSDIYYAGTEKEWEKCWDDVDDSSFWERFSEYESVAETTTFSNLTIHYEAKAPL